MFVLLHPAQQLSSFIGMGTKKSQVVENKLFFGQP